MTDRAATRRQMVSEQLADRGIADTRVLEAMERIPRHPFVPEADADLAYADRPVPIGEGQTISQPYIVGLMTEALALEGNERVLEIGTGCGYQTAVLAALAREVFTIERIGVLADRARAALDGLGIDNIRFRTGDGSLGWPEEAPFDAILAAAAAPRIPQSLIDQLAVGGCLVLPVGDDGFQDLVRITKLDDAGTTTREKLCECRFVPLLGEGTPPTG